MIVALTAGGVGAQQPPTVRISGTVESFNGHVLAIKSAKLGDVKVNLADNTAVYGVSKASRADLKPDGSLEANRVNVGRGEVVPQ